MPGWLLRLIPPGLTLLALIGTLWWIDHRGYRRAMAERDARDAALLGAMRADLRGAEMRLADRIAALDADYARQRAALAERHAALQPRLIQEMTREPRLADPALGLTPGLLDTVNRARAAGACAATAAGRIDCALPAAPPRD